ncbi:magnesium transporter CorA family protein [Actinomadura bangladeshensis]|uniref:Magnesium transporter CorA family protein n=1 Tax=Actinomadura bangladeshensis TaxID=453573 RepID=A0A6L9QTS5_9ACTN|nr:magnesium transporter CorA family protein [Actinomadura bangladeshensis]NEA28937.1 magnesium transporter CorA family protein [Actinomadura bangladeshensis]
MGSHPSECDIDEHPENRLGTAPPRTRAWRNGKVVAEGFPVPEISDYLERPDTVVWLDLTRPRHEDLRVVSDELGLDPVAVEDAVSRHERAKLDRYHGYAFLNVYVPHVDGGELVLHELSAFIAERALVTVRQDSGIDIDALIGRWDQSPDAGLTEPTAAFLLYGMLDLVIDLQLAAVQALDDEADAVEDLVFGDAFPVKEIQRRSYRLRKNLAKMRRIALPMREVLNTLLRRDLRLVPAPLVPYFQDVYDHTLRVGEWTDALRDLVADLLDTRLALQSNRMNEVMKKVTSWAAIIAVPTAVTGFYGMNVPYPGFSRHDGFIAAAIIIVLCSTVLYVIFKVRDWL